jgi:hypothetical protein
MAHQYSDHHSRPRSRGGKRTVLIPEKLHEAWHTIFGNLYGDEAVQFIEELNELFKNKKVSMAEINSLRKQCRVQ